MTPIDRSNKQQHEFAYRWLCFANEPFIVTKRISRRFHDLILRIIQGRLLLAASPKGHTLILECYHPSAKSTEPHLVCQYLGTPGLANAFQETEPIPYHAGGVGQLGQWRDLYSHFRPARQETECRVLRSHPAGEAVRLPNPKISLTGDGRLHEEPTKDLVSHDVNLDSHELFSQLCVVTHLVQLGPRSGIFYSIVNIADGVVRIWRKWLAERTKVLKSHETSNMDDRSSAHPDLDESSRMLWVDSRRNAGLLVRIRERSIRRDVPLLLHKDEDPAVSYVMEYEELRIRTAHLLQAVEQAHLEKSNVSGKAMIFGSFAQRNEI
ncbi:MAG: hypothetical protein Q9187_000697 [Circinaria calcarea]